MSSFKIINLKINGYKNLLNDFTVNFDKCDNQLVLIGNNGSGKSNLLEAISSIFSALYNLRSRRIKPGFSYEIIYEINGNVINVVYSYNNHKYDFKINKIILDPSNFKRNLERYLPKQILCSYSGEEQRIWTKFYEPFYNNYRKEIRSGNVQGTPDQSLFYINKYYWDIALLTYIYAIEFNRNLGISDRVSKLNKFIEDDLHIKNISEIKFSFDKRRIDIYEDDVLLSFVSSLNPNKDKTVKITPNKFFEKIITQKKDEPDEIITKLDFGDPRNFFKLLAACFMPKPGKLITGLEILFENNLNISVLSEGEKKILLIRCILEFLADENSLVLLDEPDAHIHITNKVKLKDLLHEYNNRSVIFTTHSPTLSHCFENKHISMMEKQSDGTITICDYSNLEIIERLTNGIWTYQDQNIFLNSNSDILLVEGKFDIVYIKEAIKKIDQEKYNCLSDLEYIPFGGASSLRLFIDKFKPKNYQNIIAILDSDIAGDNELREILKEVELRKLKKDGFISLSRLKNTYLVMLPKLDRIKNSQFEIEDYFPTDKLITVSKKQIDTFKVLKDFTLKKDTVKRKISEEVESYTKDDFQDFTRLFDVILQIKAIGKPN